MADPRFVEEQNPCPTCGRLASFLYVDGKLDLIDCPYLDCESA